MRKRWILKNIFLLLLIIIVLTNVSYAAADPIAAMAGLKNGGNADATLTSKVGPMINAVIGLIQIAGTGISLIMMTMLGIKYLLAAPNDKADVKKQIAPMLTGCIILFASVNLVQIIATFAGNLFPGT